MVEVSIIVVCLVFNGLLAAYEIAFVSISRAELRNAARSGTANAKELVALRENPERTLSAIQVGITLVGAIAAAVGGAGASDNLEPLLIERLHLSAQVAELIAIAVVVAPITYLAVVLGELVPKTLALRNPSRIVFAGARVLFLADKAFSPVITILEKSTKIILRLFSSTVVSGQAEENHSIDTSSFSPLHQRLMLNLAEIRKKNMKDIYLPWIKVVHIRSSYTLEEVNETFLASGHTRLPVLEGDEAVGLLHSKEFHAFVEKGGADWQTIVRPVLTVRSSDFALSVLRRMQMTPTHLAIVQSADKRLLGIVTIEDIIEEVVGDIYDEDDDQSVRRAFTLKGSVNQLVREAIE